MNKFGKSVPSSPHVTSRSKLNTNCVKALSNLEKKSSLFKKSLDIINHKKLDPKNCIPCYYAKPRRQSGTVLIFFHANAEDIG